MNNQQKTAQPSDEGRYVIGKSHEVKYGCKITLEGEAHYEVVELTVLGYRTKPDGLKWLECVYSMNDSRHYELMHEFEVWNSKEVAESVASAMNEFIILNGNAI